MLKNIDQELFYYEKLKEIKNQQIQSPDFKNKKNSFTTNYGAKLVNQASLTQFDGADEDEEEIPDVVPQGQEGKNYEAFNHIKQQALDKYRKKERLAKRAKNIAEAVKALKAAKRLKVIEKAKKIWNFIKTGFGITLEGLIVTYIIMLVQFWGGNVFKSKYIPPLGMIEKIIFLPIFIIAIIFQLPLIILPLATTGAFGVIGIGLQKLLSFIGVDL